jgi:heat-inducible transcriptional repressor
MAYLTDIGFLEQRHTSGGRVPTKASFRYYVNNLLNPKELTPWEMQRISEILSTNASDPERLLADASKLLADITGCAAFYSTIKDDLDCVQGIELIPAGNNKAILVMLTVSGKIKSSVCNLSKPLDDQFKKLFYYMTREFFIGVPLNEVDLSLVQSTAPLLGEKVFDMLPVLSSLCSLCQEASNGTLEIVGETHLLNQEELGSDVYKILMLMADKSKLQNLLSNLVSKQNGTALFIGDENPVYDLKNTVMTVSKLTYNETQIATLGVIGPLRMDYEAILPRINYIANNVSKILKVGGIEFE